MSKGKGPSQVGVGLPNPDEPRVTIADMRTLLTLSIDLLAICAKITGKVDPAVGAMIAYARDELGENSVKEFSKSAVAAAFSCQSYVVNRLALYRIA